MARPGGKAKEEHFAFDDDTSDSEVEEDLAAFNAKVGGVMKDGDVSDSGEGDEDSDEGDEDSDEGGEDSKEESDDESDEEVEMAEPIMSEEKKSKLSKLKEQLKGVSEDSSSDDESEESEEEDGDDEDNGDNGVLNEADAAGAAESDEEEEGKDEESEEGKMETTPNEEVKKRKLVEEETEASKQQAGEERARKKYREQLSKMSLEEIEKLKARLGLKLFQQKLAGVAPERGRKVVFARENKNRPREMTSKKTVGRFREVVQVAKRERRDPRFDPLCGEFNDKLFKESYTFVNEVKARELVALKKELKVEEDGERREKVKYLIQRMENQLRSEAQVLAKRAKEEGEVRERKEQLRAGEKPRYLSKAKQKEVDMVRQYEELKEKGGLDTFIRKKTKKNNSKERKKGLGVTQK